MKKRLLLSILFLAALRLTAYEALLIGDLHYDNADLHPGTLSEVSRRELARNLAEGNAMQYYDFSRGWTMGDRRLMQVARRLAELTDRYRANSFSFHPLQEYVSVTRPEITSSLSNRMYYAMNRMAGARVDDMVMMEAAMPTSMAMEAMRGL